MFYYRVLWRRKAAVSSWKLDELMIHYGTGSANSQMESRDSIH